MPPELQILLAIALDALLGDPRRIPHPVRLIGAFAAALERPLRALFRNAFASGLAHWLIVVSVAGAGAGGIFYAASRLHPLAGDFAAVILFYLGFAGRDLIDHAARVRRALEAGNLPEARRMAGMMVGRDTDNLDRAGVARAAVESVAENLVDGVTAPLLFAAAGGPVGLWVYKAISTLDSMFGHKDERCILFGRVAARMDDAANYLPARLTAPLIAVAACITGLNARLSLRILRRDGNKHESPNAGLSESAFAGALDVELGGVNHYGGEPEFQRLMNAGGAPVGTDHIRKACCLAIASALLFLLIVLAARALATGWLQS